MASGSRAASTSLFTRCSSSNRCKNKLYLIAPSVRTIFLYVFLLILFLVEKKTRGLYFSLVLSLSLYRSGVITAKMLGDLLAENLSLSLFLLLLY